MNHIMVDLETLGSGPTAAIVSIGAVRMDFEKLELREEFYTVVDFASPVALTPGTTLTIDGDTVRWWLGQSEEARAVFQRPGVPLPEALQLFSEFVHEVGVRTIVEPPVIWGNGATFDNMILRNAYCACGLMYPASYRNDLCYRTMRRMFPTAAEKSDVTQGVAHNALDDARRQARNLLEITRRIRGV